MVALFVYTSRQSFALTYFHKKTLKNTLKNDSLNPVMYPFFGISSYDLFAMLRTTP